MLIRLRTIAGLLFAGLCLPRTSIAQTPMTVAVRAEFVVPRFRDRFANRQAVEARVAALFTDYLTRKVGFLRFATTDSALPYRLSFVLDREPRNTSSFSEVGFWVRLDRPGDTQLQMYWLPFRTADQSIAGAGTEADLLAEVKSKLEHHDPDSLRRGILRWVPIAHSGLPNLNPLGFVLPFRLLDLCMRNQSELEFVAEIKGTITTEEQFKGRIVGNFTPSGPRTAEVEPFFGGGFGKIVDLSQPDELSPSITKKAVQLKKVFVTSYVHDPTACDNRTPRAVGTGTP